MDRVVEAAEAFAGVLAIVAAVVLGVLVPPPPAAEAAVSPVVAVLVYASLQGVSAELVSARSAAAVGLSLAIGYLVVPALAALVGPALLPERLFIGLFVVLAGPTTVGSAIVWTRLDDGDATLTALTAVLSVALSPVVVPALFVGLLSTSVSLDPVAIGVDLMTVLAAGVVLTLLVPGDTFAERTLDRLALAAIAALVYVAVGTTGLGGTRPVDVVAVAAAVVAVDLVVLAATAAGGRLLGLPAPQRRSVRYAAGLKNLAIALLVAAAIDGAPVLPIVVFYVLQQLVGSIRAEASIGRSPPSG